MVERRKLLVSVLVAILVIALAAAAGLLLRHVLSSGVTRDALREAQAEAVADYYEALMNNDAALMRRVVPEEAGDAVTRGMGEGEPSGYVSERTWDGDTLVLRFDEGPEIVRADITAPGTRDEAEVEVLLQYRDGETAEETLLLELEERGWVVADVGGRPVEDVLSPSL